MRGDKTGRGAIIIRDHMDTKGEGTSKMLGDEK